MEPFEDTKLVQLRGDPLSPLARAQHRNLLLISALALLLVRLNLVPTHISALGVDLKSAHRQHGIRFALLLAVVYFLVAFVAAAVVDFTAWRGAHEEAGVGRKQALENIAHLRDMVIKREQALGGQAPSKGAIHAHESAVKDLLRWQRRHAFYRVLLPFDNVRGMLDFLVPVGIASWAIVELSIALI